MNFQRVMLPNPHECHKVGAMTTTKSAHNVDFNSGQNLQFRKSWWWWVHFVNGGNGKVALTGLHTLTPKRCQGHFVAYEWQWTSMGNRGRRFFIHLFLEQLVRLVVHHIQLRITMGGLPLFVSCNKNGWPCSVFLNFPLYLLKLNLSHKYDLYCTWA
jgi:hypothetical protein